MSTLEAMKPFTPEHLAALHAEYAKVNIVDPTSEAFTQLRAYVASLSVESQTQLAEANIRWLSYLARQEISKQK